LKTDTKPLKAYTVREEDEGHAVVVFASTNVAARRDGAGRLDAEFGSVECHRSPEFDAYAEAGKVPPLVMIAHDWWFECGHCGRTVSRDAYLDDDEGEPMEPAADGQWVYCSEAHRMAHWAERRVVAAREAAAIEACAIRFHGLPLTNLRGVRHYSVCGGELVDACDFDFPGRVGMLARWNIGDDHVFVSQCDVDAWKAVQATVGPA